MDTDKRHAAAAANCEILLTRIFDAPRQLVFRAWMDPERLQRWYAPGGCTLRFARLEPRVGGSFHSCIRGPDGSACWCTGVYKEVVEPERIVFTMAIANSEGKAISPEEAGMDPEWPRETVVTVTFEDQGGKTRLTLHQTVSESLAKRTGAYPSWIDMLGRLAGELARG